jgi:hypothetical protein
MRQRNQPAVLRSPNVMDGRAGYHIRSEWGTVAVLEGGGHICELHLNNVPDVNPLWRPPWATIDPYRYSSSKHRRVYGIPPDGKLLAGIAGHSLSFDHFGPPSKEEVAAGLSTHGEAPAMKWRRLKNPASSRPALHYGCTLHESQINFRRAISVDRARPVIHCEERAENLSRSDRPISWNQHVTFGPPFLECGITIFDMPATRAKVCPPEYSQKNFLQPNAEFVWPEAPRKDGGHSNLRTMPQERFGHYTAQLLDPRLDIAFISACNPSQRLLLVYAFRRVDFPWVGNWEERNNRTSAPWKGRTFCRGIEFSTTPFAIPLRDTIDQGTLFGEQTYRWLPARSSLSVRFLIMLFEVPEDFAGVKRVSIEQGVARVLEVASRERELSVAVGTFLSKT